MPLTSRRRWAALSATVGGLVAALVMSAAPAVAVVAPDRPTLTPAQFPITVDTTVPAGGQAWVGSPSLPTTGRRISVRVSSSDMGAGAEFGSLFTHLATLTNKDRLLTCSAIGQNSLNAVALAQLINRPTLGLAELASARGAMRMCFQIVAFLASQGPGSTARDDMRAPMCPVATVSVPIEATGTGGEPDISIAGAASTPRKPALRVTCRVRGGDLVIGVRVRSKKASLRSIVGERLTLGFAGAPGSTADIPITLTFGMPH